MSYRNHKLSVDWAQRVGSVSACENSLRVYVLWDGRRSSEVLDPRSLEKL
jgi:hypothetical protein